MLCGHLSSLPRYLAGCSSDHPDGNPSQTGGVSDSTHTFWKEACLGKPRCVVDPQTWTINETTLVSPGEICTRENASQVTRKCYCIIYFKSLTSSLILHTYSFQSDLHRVNWLNFTASLWAGKTITQQSAEECTHQSKATQGQNKHWKNLPQALH